MRLYRLCTRVRPLFSPSFSWRKEFVIGCRRYRDGPLFQRSLLPRNMRNTTDSPKSWMHSEVDTLRSLRYGIENEGRILKVTWANGETAAFLAVWLRHNCQCPSCVTSSNQKTIDPAILDPSTTVIPNKLSGGVLALNWSCGHSGYIREEWLRNSLHSNPVATATSDDLSRPTVATELPKLSATALSHDEGLWTWLKHLNEYGLCLLTDLPTELGTLKQVCKKLYNNVQATIYGELFEVRSEDNPINIAYSDVELDFHMDLVYYESPPGLQLLHCVRNDNCVEGGESVMLDMFFMAEQLRAEHPDHFQTLTRVPATFQKIHYDREDPVEMMCQRPHIMVDREGRIIATTWAPPFEGPLKCTMEDVAPYYEAYHCFANMLKNSKLKLSHRLLPGEAMTFNNRRILHSRAAFKLNGGVRHLQGAYVNIDEFKSKFQVLCTKLGHSDYPVKRVFNQQST